MKAQYLINNWPYSVTYLRDTPSKELSLVFLKSITEKIEQNKANGEHSKYLVNVINYLLDQDK